MADDLDDFIAERSATDPAFAEAFRAAEIRNDRTPTLYDLLADHLVKVGHSGDRNEAERFIIESMKAGNLVRLLRSIGTEVPTFTNTIRTFHVEEGDDD